MLMTVYLQLKILHKNESNEVWWHQRGQAASNA